MAVWKSKMVAAALAVSAALIGGGAALALGGSSGSSDSVTGSWLFKATGYPDRVLTLQQSGDSFTGTDSTGYATSIKGTNKSGKIDMTINFSDGLVMTAKGRLSSDGTTMSGTYTDAYPNESPDSGTWSAARK